MDLNPESAIQLMNLVVSSILTIALIYLYKKQSETLANQTSITGKQTQIMESQNTLLELQQSPHIEILFWSIQENEIEVQSVI